MPYIHIFSAFTEYFESVVVQGGYIFLFVTTTFEGIPLFGALIPGHITIIVSGFLAKIGVFDIWWVLSVAAVGAIVGDCIGYVIGRKYGLVFIDRLKPYFFITDAHIQKTNELLAKHTGKAMIFGRFSPVTRALMPFLVGAHGVHVRKFWFYNIIGGISWTAISVLVGYLFGAGYHAAAGYMGKFVFGALLMGLCIMWGYRFVNMRFHIFRKYELFVLALNLAALYILAKTIQDAWSLNSFMAHFDVYVNMMIDSIESAKQGYIACAIWVTTVGSVAVTSSVGGLISFYLVVKKRWRSATILILSISLTGISTGMMKTVFERVRPDNALIPLLNDPSFPSGHAAMAAALCVCIGYIAAQKIHSMIYRELMIVCCTIVAALIGLSRIVLNVHWVSDVVAGWSLGIFLATGSILLVRYVGVLLARK